MRKTAFPIFFFLFFPFFAAAQKAKFEFFTTADGLAGNQTESVTQDDRGYIWFINENKLLRFDGRNFVRYPPPPPKIAGSTEPFIAVLKYRDTLLFIASRHFVFLLDPKNGHWDSFQVPAKHAIGYCAQVSENDVFIQFLNENNAKQPTFWHFRDQHFEPASLPESSSNWEYLNWCTADTLGNTYLFTAGRLQIFDRSGKQAAEIPITQTTGKGWVKQSQFADGNSCTVLVDFKSLFIFDKQNRTFRPHPVNRFLVRGKIGLRSFFVQKNGNIWAVQFDKTNLLFYDAERDTVFSSFGDLEKLIPQGFEIRDLFEDRSGSIWVDGRLGLLKVTPQVSLFDNYFSERNTDKNQGFYSFRGMAEDAEGMVYAGFYGGVAKIDPVKKRGGRLDLPAFLGFSPFGLFSEKENIWLNNGQS